jgi:hypothetical protein
VVDPGRGMEDDHARGSGVEHTRLELSPKSSPVAVPCQESPNSLVSRICATSLPSSLELTVTTDPRILRPARLEPVPITRSG